MPRFLGVLILAGAAALVGVYAWFGLVWLLSAAAKLTPVQGLNIALFMLAPHIAGWLVALALAIAVFVLALRYARRHGISWLGFADAARSATSADAPSSPPSFPGR